MTNDAPRPGSGTFWERGVRFKCQGTGRCCTSRGPYGYVYVTLNDRRRLAAHLGMRTSSFTRRHCKRDHEHVHLVNPKRDCCFLQDGRCGVYEARPTQCRTWPFWAENMKPLVWEHEIKACCPGVGKGRRHTATQIQAILTALQQEDELP